MAKGPSPRVWARGTVITTRLVLSEVLFKGFHGKGLWTKAIPDAKMNALPTGTSVRNRTQQLQNNLFQ